MLYTCSKITDLYGNLQCFVLAGQFEGGGNPIARLHIQLIKWYQNVIIMNRYEQDVFCVCVCVCGVMMYVPFKRAKTLKKTHIRTYEVMISDVKCLDLERPSTTPAENCRWATLCSPKARDRLCHPWRLVEWLAWSSSEEAQRFWICCQPLSLNTFGMVKKQPEQTWWANHQFSAFPPHDPVCGCVSTILPFLFQQLLSGRIFRKTLRKSTSGCASSFPRPGFMVAQRPASQPSHPRRWHGRWFHPHRRRTPAESRWQGRMGHLVWVNWFKAHKSKCSPAEAARRLPDNGPGHTCRPQTRAVQSDGRGGGDLCIDSKEHIRLNCFELLWTALWVFVQTNR